MEHHCHFCGKKRNEVHLLMVMSKDKAGGICDTCVKICIDNMFRLKARELAEAVNIQKTYGVEETLANAKQSDSAGSGRHSPDNDDGKAVPEQAGGAKTDAPPEGASKQV